jgi:UDP-glucuronate 4-epimerase
MTEKCVLVTGGAGFIGSHLTERLLKSGRKVICLDNFDPFYDPAIKRANLGLSLRHPDFTLVEGDIRDPNTLSEIFRSNEVATIVHLAAMAGVRPSVENPQLYNEVNILGTTNLLQQCRETGVAKFVFGSSSSVYGLNDKVPFSEDAAVGKTASPYGATKLAGEVLCHTYHHLYGIPTVCLRFFTVYGPRQRPEMAIHKFIRLVHEAQEVPVFGDGRSQRDYTYVDDIVDGIVSAMELDCQFEVINLGRSETVVLLEMIHLIEGALGTKARIKFLPLQMGDVPITFASVKRAGRLLGYEPAVSITEGIDRTVRWFREERATSGA